VYNESSTDLVHVIEYLNDLFGIFVDVEPRITHCLQSVTSRLQRRQLHNRITDTFCLHSYCKQDCLLI